MAKKPYGTPVLVGRPLDVDRKSWPACGDRDLLGPEQVGNFDPGKIFYDRDADQLRRLPLILG